MQEAFKWEIKKFIALRSCIAIEAEKIRFALEIAKKI